MNQNDNGEDDDNDTRQRQRGQRGSSCWELSPSDTATISATVQQLVQQSNSATISATMKNATISATMQHRVPEQPWDNMFNDIPRAAVRMCEL